jgi:alkanesulfonate monooxygenase SsuD/methylene tetrahydromethanopterin reductase-like flavin-dependent oxidoreductase (luciferase family)
MVAPSSHPAFAWSIVGWLDFLDFIQPVQKIGVTSMCDAFVLQEPGDWAQTFQGLPEREMVKIVVLGSAAGVREQIHKLHVLGFADGGDWSRLLPVPEETVVMSVLVLYRRR